MVLVAAHPTSNDLVTCFGLVLERKKKKKKKKKKKELHMRPFNTWFPAHLFIIYYLTLPLLLVNTFLLYLIFDNTFFYFL